MGVFKTVLKGGLTGGVTLVTDGVKKAKYGTTKSSEIKKQKELRKHTELLREIAEHDD